MTWSDSRLAADKLDTSKGRLSVTSIWKLTVWMLTSALVLGCAATAPGPGTAVPHETQAAASAGASPVSSASAPQLGGQVVFADGKAGSSHWQIYIENADGSSVRQLVRSDADDFTPSLSPDGTQVVFHRVDVSGTQDQILVVNIDGTHLHEVKPGGCPSVCSDAVEGARAWSRDDHILFVRAIFKGVLGVVNVGIWVMNADGTEAHQLTNTGLECPNVCAGGSQDDEAAWSPDGKRVVFLHDLYTKPEQFSIFTMAPDGSNVRQLTPVGMDVGDPDWSPDGARIVFQSPSEPVVSGEQNIYTIRPDGTGITQLTEHLSSGPSGGQGTFHPCWSPDGTEIVFSHSPGLGGEGADLFVMNADGSGLRVLAATTLNENAACWGPTPGG